MKVKINVNNKTIEVEINEKQLKELGLVAKRITGYERVKKEDNYYSPCIYGDDAKGVEKGSVIDDELYNIGNYYSDKIIAKNNARADRLLRQLRRWQAQNDEPISVEDWNNESKKKWFIIYSSEEMYAEYYYIMRLPNTIYFATKEKAEEAIEVFRDELLWYFTEYVQRLDEVQNG